MAFQRAYLVLSSWQHDSGVPLFILPPLPVLGVAPNGGCEYDNAEQVAIPSDILDLSWTRTCTCAENHASCVDAKAWMKAQLGVWQFYYGKRDIREKEVHPATFPIALSRRWIELLTHRGELVLDPFAGAGTTLLAAQDSGRNAVGFDLHAGYVALARERLRQASLLEPARPLVVQADARTIERYLAPETVSLVVTSLPYANLLNRPRKNKSRRGPERRNGQYLKTV